MRRYFANIPTGDKGLVHTDLWASLCLAQQLHHWLEQSQTLPPTLNTPIL